MKNERWVGKREEGRGKGVVNVGGNGGTEGKGGICKCEWKWGNRGKRYGDVKVGGRAGTEGGDEQREEGEDVNVGGSRGTEGR